MKDYYKTLNLTASASEDAIKRNYRTLAKMYHPDVNPGNESAAKRFAEITEAYDVLTDPQKRAEYDRKVKAERDAEKARAEARAAYNRPNPAPRSQTAYNRPNPTAQNQAQYEAQVQADANAVLKAVADKAYKDGYAAGYKSADENAKKLSHSIDKLTRENTELKTRAREYISDRKELETELFDRDRELARESDRNRELETQIAWLKQASDLGNKTTTASKQVDSAKRRIQSLRDALAKNGDGSAAITDTTVLAQHARRKEINEQLIKLDKAMELLSAEISDMDAAIERRRKLNETDRFISSMETRAEAWAKKTSADIKLAKNTLYGSLGVLIWATDEQIDEAYEKLVQRYATKTDDKSRELLQKIKQAYATLHNADKRREYDASIGFTEEKIIHEQALAKENESVQKEYRDKLAAREFWARFDELSSLALSGDAEAQNLLGELYYKGGTIERDFTHAVYWFREAFEAKLPAAMYNLGVCYRNGEGVSRNATIANALFRQAELRGLKILDRQ